MSENMFALGIEWKISGLNIPKGKQPIGPKFDNWP